jgi:threonine dehydratase
MHDSLAQGRALVDYEGGETLCEGLEGAVAERTYRVAREHGLEVVLVDEEETLAAIGFAYRALGLVVEPSAAVGLAAARVGRVPTDEETVIVVTGSNIEPALLDRAIAVTDRGGAR